MVWYLGMSFWFGKVDGDILTDCLDEGCRGEWFKMGVLSSLMNVSV